MDEVISGVTKHCWICKCIKPVTEFNKTRTAMDGLEPRCRECSKEIGRRYRQNKERLKVKNQRARAKARASGKKVDNSRAVRQAKLQLQEMSTEPRPIVLRPDTMLIKREKAYQQFVNLQNGVCAICGASEGRRREGRKRSLSLDHDHITGEFRGVLCDSCNVGLGMFRDRQDLLANAIQYLECSKKDRTG